MPSRESAKSPTGMKETAYRIVFVHSSPLCIMRRIVAPSAIIIMKTKRNNKVKPRFSLLGKEWLKSTNRNGDVVITRNTTTDVKANEIDSTSATVKNQLFALFLKQMKLIVCKYGITVLFVANTPHHYMKYSSSSDDMDYGLEIRNN